MRMHYYLFFFFCILGIKKLKLGLSNLSKIFTRKWQSCDLDPCLWSFKSHNLNSCIYHPFNEVRKKDRKVHIIKKKKQLECSFGSSGEKWGAGGVEKCGQEVQTSSNKISKSWR